MKNECVAETLVADFADLFAVVALLWRRTSEKLTSEKPVLGGPHVLFRVNTIKNLVFQGSEFL